MKKFFTINSRDFNVLDLASIIIVLVSFYYKNLFTMFLALYLFSWSQSAYFSFNDYKKTKKVTFKIGVDIFIFISSSILLIYAYFKS